MSSFSPLIFHRNVDGNNNPVSIPLEESITVFNNRGYTTQIPDEFYRVSIPDMVEIDFRKPITSVNQYKVPYGMERFICFHPDKEGTIINVSYYGVGYYHIASNNISIEVDVEGNTTKTLDDYVAVENTRQTTFETNEAAREAQFDTLIQTAYTAQEAVKKFAYLEAALGNSVQIKDTIDAPLAEMEIRGETKGTPVDPLQPVSPDNPQTLTSQANFDYLLSGRNQFNKAATPSVTSASTSLVETDTGVTVSNTILGARYKGFVLNVKAGLTYHIKASSTRTGITGGGIIVFNYTGSLGSALGGNASTLNPDFSFVALSSGQIAVLFYSNASTDATASATFSNVQLEVGSAATPYEAYIAPVTASITLKDTLGNQLENRGIPATYNHDGTVATWAAQDRVFRDVDGKYKLRSDTVKFVFNGSENWVYNSSYDNTNTVMFYITTGTALTRVTNEGTISSFQYSPSVLTNDVESWRISNDTSGTISIRISKTRATDLASFKIWLAGNNVTCICKRITPTITELHSDNQTAFAAAAKSFDGITNISLSTALGQVYAVAAKNTEVLKDTAGTLATRPTVGKRIGHIYTTTNEAGGEKVYLWTGTQWKLIS